MTKRGVFITLEGGDGTGKSTQAKMLAAALAARGVVPVLTREPGGTPQAERIRDLLLQRDSGHFDPMTEALLLFAARREHLVSKIQPALANGDWVISDRFADSSRAFQGYGMGLDLDVIENLYSMVAGDFAPDLTLIFDIEPEKGLARSAHKKASTANKTESGEDRYELMGLEFQKRLRKGFLEIARQNPDRCVIINADNDIDAVHADIMQIIEERFALSPVFSGLKVDGGRG